MGSRYLIPRAPPHSVSARYEAEIRTAARWKARDGDLSRDDIVILEVLAESLDAGWWRTYRATLEARFQQDVVVVRATPIVVL